jgi:hypothetical protein
MGTEPVRKGVGGAIRQHVYWAMALPVNKKRSIGVAATKCEVINAKNRRDHELLCDLRLGKA